jgi:Secretion system C-terminal sorting domain
MVAEFPGTTTPCTGDVLAVGAGGYDWYLDGGLNEDRPNLELFTSNMLNYLRSGCVTGIFEPAKNELPTFAFPNPVAEELTIVFSMEKSESITAEITDISGRRVAILAQNETVGAGSQKLLWQTGSQADGIYFYRISAGEKTAVGKVVLSKN